MNSTEEFLKAWNNRPVREKIEIEYRAYYENKTVISACSGDKKGLWPDGKYVIIDEQLYKDVSRLYRSKVVNGKLVEIRKSNLKTLQLERAETGPFTSLPNNIIFAAAEGDNYKEKEYEVESSSNR